MSPRLSFHSSLEKVSNARVQLLMKVQGYLNKCFTAEVHTQTEYERTIPKYV